VQWSPCHAPTVRPPTLPADSHFGLVAWRYRSICNDSVTSMPNGAPHPLAHRAHDLPPTEHAERAHAYVHRGHSLVDILGAACGCVAERGTR
jgi:hypothetical protein